MPGYLASSDTCRFWFFRTWITPPRLASTTISHINGEFMACKVWKETLTLVMTCFAFWITYLRAFVHINQLQNKEKIISISYPPYPPYQTRKLCDVFTCIADTSMILTCFAAMLYCWADGWTAFVGFQTSTVIVFRLDSGCVVAVRSRYLVCVWARL